MKKEYPRITYGAVYFRKSNPPREDWARDYAQAAADGMNMFRHWFLWGAIERKPGVYDWVEYDEHLALAAKNGMGTVIAEFADCVPEWFYHGHKDCFCMSRTGVQAPYSGLSASCAVGGFVPGGLCLDNPKTREYVERFLRALAGHYKGHPGLFGYDVWNECNFDGDMCFCEHTQQAFREWLKAKYGSLDALMKAWYRYGYESWEQVEAPRFTEQHPQCLDWLLFRKENFYRQYDWKVNILRSVDPDARITNHGVAATLDYTYGNGNDDWMAAEQAESYGLTWVMGRKGTEPWKQWQAMDLVRAASRGKPFWHAEMQGGPLWLQPQVIGRTKDDGRVATAEDVRLWNLVSLAGGARGILYLRWRSLLDGPLFGSFGLYANDGLPNDRSRAASQIAKWANGPATEALFAAKPVRADVGIIVLDKIQWFNKLVQQAGPQKFYSLCQWGIYRAFFDSRLQADWVHFKDIDEYKILYFAYPIQLDAADARKLEDWVRRGGRLICEGLPGYFGDGGKVGTVQPNNGLDGLFGVTEETVEFMPDLGDAIEFDALGVQGVPGGLFRQAYRTAGAKALGTYPDGAAAVTVKRHGDGMAILIGTFPSEGYHRTSSPAVRELLGKLLELAGAASAIDTLQGDVTARLWEGDGRRFLWILNHNREAQTARIRVNDCRTVSIGAVYWGATDAARTEGQTVLATVPGKDAVVVELKR